MDTMKFFFSALFLCLTLGLFAQNNADGNQTEVKLQKKLLFSGSDFSSLDIEKIGKVVLSYGPESKIELECPVGEHSYIKAKQSGQKVSISSKNSTAVSHSTLFVTLNSSKLKLDASAVGRIESDGTISIETISIKGLAIGSMQLDVQSKLISVEGKAFGDVVLSGTCGNSKFDILAINSLNCSALQLEGAQVQVKSSSDIQLNVSTFLELDLSACPSVSVIGEPIVKVLHKDPQVKINTIN